MRLFSVLLVAAVAASAAERCDPPPELQEFIRSLPTDNHAKRSAIEERLKQTPDDFTLNRLFVGLAIYERAPVRERYRRLIEAHPDSLDYQYLRARSLVGSNTKEALRIYSQVLEKDADYPWVHLSQLEIYRSPVFRDRQKLQASFTAITRVCPGFAEPYEYLNEIPDNDFASRAAEKLRALLLVSRDPHQLRLFRILWNAEVRLRPAEERDRERRQVAEDLRQLLPFEADPAIRTVLQDGARRAGDPEMLKRIVWEVKPDANQLVMTKSNAWVRDHPEPKSGDSPAMKYIYALELAGESYKWQKLAAENPIGYYHRVRALIMLGAPAERIASAGDELLALIRRKDPTTSTWIVTLARQYMESGVLLDRVRALVAEAIQRLDDPEAIIESDLAPDHAITARNRQLMASHCVQALVVLAQTYEKLGDRNRAHETLGRASDFLASHAPSSEEPDEQVRVLHAMARYAYLRVQAEMAEREGRKLDALNGYREAVAVRPMDHDDLMLRQKNLWRDLGGSDEGWLQWVSAVGVVAPKTESSRPSAGAAPSALNRKLPPFSARDMAGNR